MLRISEPEEQIWVYVETLEHIIHECDDRYTQFHNNARISIFCGDFWAGEPKSLEFHVGVSW